MTATTTSVALTQQTRDLVAAAQFAVLATRNDDGSTHACVMWADIEGDDLVLPSRLGRRQVRNLERDPRATVLIYSRIHPVEYVEVRGTATVSPDPRGALVDRLARRYTGEGHAGLDPERDTDRIVLRLRPTLVGDHPRPR